MIERNGYYTDTPAKRLDPRYQSMDYLQRGMFEWLRDECWLNGSIPAAPEDIAELLGYPVLLFPAQWRLLKHCFEPNREKTRLTCPSVEAERRRRDEKRRIAERAGIQSGAQRRAKIVQPQVFSNHENLNDRSTDVELVTSNKEQVTSFSCPVKDSDPVVDSVPEGGGTTPPPPICLSASAAPVAADQGRGPEPHSPLTQPERRRVTPLKKPSNRQPRTPVPQGYVVDDALKAFCAREGITVCDLQAEVDACMDHFRACGETRSDWMATIRNWLRNGPRYGFKAPANQRPQQFGAIPHGAYQERGRASTPALDRKTQFLDDPVRHRSVN